MKQYTGDTGQQLSYITLGGAQNCIFIWAHGWGRSHADFLPLAQSLTTLGTHYLIDFPGFGQSPRPTQTWGTEQYADFVAEWLDSLPAVPKIWIGHSFGCRVGLRLAAKHPRLVTALYLIAAPGLPKKMSFWQRLQRCLRICVSKPLKLLLPACFIEKAKNYVGSADYRSAGNIRDILLATIEEDLTVVASHIHCDTYLVYGELDEETPTEIGRRYHQLLKNSMLVTLPHLNHQSLLTEGRHQILKQLKELTSQII